MRLQLPRREQPRNRIEIIVLIEIEQHVAVVQILHVLRRQAVGIRLDVLGLAAAGANASSNPLKRSGRRLLITRCTHHSQSLIVNSG